MFKLQSDISIGNYNFTSVVNVKIERSSRQIIGGATIELPLQMTLQNNNKKTIAKAIKRGDNVVIKLGYSPNLNLEFEGFVSNIKAKANKTIIECQDNSFLLQKSVPNKAFKQTTLKKIVQFVADNCGIELNSEIPEVNISDFILKNVTGLDVIKKIKEAYGLQAFFDYDGKLYVGLAYTYKTGKVEYNLQKDLPKNQTNLEFKEADDIKYKIKAISILKDNTRLEIETGDADGELRTLYFNGITDKTELEKLANEEIKKYKYSGYKGNIKAFGEPQAKFGMSAKIKDDNYPQREGNYYIESIKIDFGQSGFRRTVELGIKL